MCCSVTRASGSPANSAADLQASKNDVRSWWHTEREQVTASVCGTPLGVLLVAN